LEVKKRRSIFAAALGEKAKIFEDARPFVNPKIEEFLDVKK